jgi:hypothetical protein
MSNMSYCRFENTYPDLLDCYENWTSVDDDDSERTYRIMIQKLCIKIVKQYAHDFELLTQDQYERLVG